MPRILTTMLAFLALAPACAHAAAPRVDWTPRTPHAGQTVRVTATGLRPLRRVTVALGRARVAGRASRTGRVTVRIAARGAAGIVRQGRRRLRFRVRLRRAGDVVLPARGARG